MPSRQIIRWSHCP